MKLTMGRRSTISSHAQYQKGAWQLDISERKGAHRRGSAALQQGGFAGWYASGAPAASCAAARGGAIWHRRKRRGPACSPGHVFFWRRAGKDGENAQVSAAFCHVLPCPQVAFSFYLNKSKRAAGFSNR